MRSCTLTQAAVIPATANRATVLCRYICFFVLFFLSLTLGDSAKAAETIIYLTGGGSARAADIQKRIDSIWYNYQRGRYPAGTEVFVFTPNHTLPGPGGRRHVLYSQSQLTDIVNLVKSRQGPDLHIEAISLGAGQLRDHIIPRVIREASSLTVGSVTMVEAMNIFASPQYFPSSAFVFDMFVSLETPYYGRQANLFQQTFNTGGMRPANCTAANCYFLHHFNDGLVTRICGPFVAQVELQVGDIMRFPAPQMCEN
ncbi:hypothetical protein MRY87_06995, partial [bacterium]|nr:hypothetical protein [bacterium]